MCGYYYGTNMLKEISQTYDARSIIRCSSKLSAVMTDCYILVPRQ
jgi:hypothetical protein